MDEEEFSRAFNITLKKLQDLLGEYETRSPDWFAHALLERVLNALESFRLYLEDPEREEVSWDSPSGTFLYPLAWDWERSTPAVHFTPEDFEDEERFTDKMAKAFHVARDPLVFGALTNWVAVGVEGGERFYLLPDDLREELENLPQEEGRKRLEELYTPQKMEFSFSNDDVKGFISLIFWPLEVDYNRREAGFPLTVELVFEEGDLKAWNKKEREGFWEALLGPLREEVERLSPWARLEPLPAPYFRAPSAKENYFLLPAWGTFQPQVMERFGQQFIVHYRYRSEEDSFAVQQVLDDPTLQGYEVARVVNRALGVEGLKVWDGLLLHMNDNHCRPYFVLEKGAFLDSLGYKRQRGGLYHHDKNVEMLERVLRTLQRIEINGEFTERRGKRKRTRKISGPLITITAELKEWDHAVGQRPEEGAKLYDGVVIQMNPFLYEGIRRVDGSRGNQFTWIPRGLPAENARKHGLALFLMNYYPIQWRMQADKGGVLRRKLGTILSEAGIGKPSPPNRARFLQKLREEHDYMVERGYIGSWRIHREELDPFESVWEVTAPEDFPLFAVPGGRGRRAIK